MCNFCSVIAGGDYRQNGLTDTGAPVIVTYNFPRDRDLAWDQQQADVMLIEATRIAMDHVEEVAGIRTVEVDRDADAMIRVSYNTSYDGVSWATYPYSTRSSPNTTSDVAMSPVFADFDIGGFGYEILLHEIGHALGLKHPFEQPNPIDPAFDNTDYTVMSYTTVSGPQTAFQELDVKALRNLYGQPDAFDGVTTSFDRASNVLTVTGTNRPETLIAVNDGSRIRGRDGQDTLIGRDGRDTLEGELGDDRLEGLGSPDQLVGHAGDDVLLGQGGGDVLSGGSRRDTLRGGAGDDMLRGQRGSDRLFGESGDDRLNGAGADDRLYGGGQSDELLGYGGRDTIRGGDGPDSLHGGTLDDALFGGRGDDLLRGEEGNDGFRGGAGNDRLYGGSGDDRLSGESGNDLVKGQDGSDLVLGGAGSDTIVGDRGADRLRGDSDDDFLFGRSDGDWLDGGEGRDKLRGEGGQDTLVGGGGQDVLFGGPGADAFVVTQGNFDAVKDFEVGTDLLDVSGLGITAPQARALLTARGSHLWFEDGETATMLVGLAGTAPSDIDFIV